MVSSRCQLSHNNHARLNGIVYLCRWPCVRFLNEAMCPFVTRVSFFFTNSTDWCLSLFITERTIGAPSHEPVFSKGGTAVVQRYRTRELRNFGRGKISDVTDAAGVSCGRAAETTLGLK
jgi:hypothetical protein